MFVRTWLVKLLRRHFNWNVAPKHHAGQASQLARKHGKIGVADSAVSDFDFRLIQT
jgi:hypothetical protein